MSQLTTRYRKIVSYIEQMPASIWDFVWTGRRNLVQVLFAGYIAACAARLIAQLAITGLVVLQGSFDMDVLYGGELALDAGTMIFGGYVALRFARAYFIAHAALLSLLYGATVVASICALSDSTPGWFRIALSVMPGPAAFFGGHLQRSRELRRGRRFNGYARIVRRSWSPFVAGDNLSGRI
jgi:hypothetical protein